MRNLEVTINPISINFKRSEVMLSRPHIVAISILSALASVNTAWADAIDINLRDTSAQVQYKSSLGRDPLGKTEFHLGLLYVDKNNLLSDLGVVVKDDIGSKVPGLSVGIGIKGLIAKVRGSNPVNSKASALALGALVRYSPSPIPRMGIVGEVYLSPNIVTFGDVNRYSEIVTRVEYEVIPSSTVYAGYRRVSFGLTTQPDAILDKGVYAGVKISF
jgi:hypothetical protein